MQLWSVSELYTSQSTCFQRNSPEKDFDAIDYIYISIILTPTLCVVPVVCFESYEPGGL